MSNPTDDDRKVACEICGKKYGKITPQHLRTHNITMEQYNQKYIYKDPDDVKITCKICGKKYLQITPLHLGTHNTTMEQYKRRYPNDPVMSAKSKSRMRDSYLKKQVKEVEPEEIIVEESVLDEEPDIEEISPVIEKETFEVVKKSTNKLISTKEDILDVLLSYFSNVKPDYMIRELNLTNHILYEHITDFCDPVLKVVIDFPNAFFHNTDRYVNLARDTTLESDGWKIIKIRNLSNIRKQLDKELY